MAIGLQLSLKKVDITGHIAELKQEYDILISDKIKDEIDKSKYLVAIITENSLYSASVHEEIGYALGIKRPVLLMVEESVQEKGVLIFGKEPEIFTRKFFSTHADKITEFIKNKGIQENKSKTESSESFLKKRNLDLESEDFGKNENTEFLWARIDDSLLPNGKPYVLFSVCPKNLTDRVDPNSNNLSKWLKEQSIVEIKKDQKCHFLVGTKKIKLNSISFHNSPIGDERIYKYIEFHKNGFIEQGITDPIVLDYKEQDGTHACLHLCYLTGAFWAFLKFCKKYYDEIGFNEEFDVFLSIHNSQDLTLCGFGGTLKEGQAWAEPFSSYLSTAPITNEKNIMLSIESITKEQLTDEFIEKKAHKISNQVSNAYGISFARCYNHDGTFNFKMFSWYNV